MVTVACVFWGDKFSTDYVYNLKRAVERNTTIEHRFVCLSDKPLQDIETIPLKPGFDGWWNKMQLFDGRLMGRVVYIDLDTLIVGNIDWLLTYNGKFAGIEDLGSVNKHQPHLKGQLQSGMLAFSTAALAWVWMEFLLKHNSITKKYRGDGEYLNALMFNRDLLQNIYPNQIRSYKYQVYPDKIERASVICFHGRPSIVQSTSETVTTPTKTYEPQPWVKDFWY